MSESSASLAIVEKKPQIKRSGGCVGIFFQLFDWNRRFAKNKFFPKKLLSPARAKLSKKFNADEKLPGSRNLLIADENSGGFPGKMRKKSCDLKLNLDNKKSEMQAPGLIARLMGLEVMPTKGDCQGKGGNGNGGGSSFDSSPEKGNVRPQKLQRTGIMERRSVARFGAEALQIKNVLTRTRKHHYHPKLVSPVKSPKMGRNGSKLIDAAARILEPGIQATSRARYSLSYPRSKLQNQCSSVLNEAQVPNEDGACHSCGNVFGLVDADGSGSEFRERFFCEVEGSKSRPVVYLENENDVVLLKTGYQTKRTGTKPEDSAPVENAPIRNGTRPSQYLDQIPMSRVFSSQRDTQRSVCLKNRVQRPGQMLGGDRVPPKMANTHCRRELSPICAVTEAKDFIAINRNIGQSRPRAVCKPDTSFDANKKFQTGKNDTVPTHRIPVRKKRTAVANRQADNVASANSISERHRSSKGNAAMGTGPRVRANALNQSSLRCKPASHRGNKGALSTSPVKSLAGTKHHNESGVRRRDQETVPQQLIREENDYEQLSRNSLQMNGDALGTLLEQKLKELTNQAVNEAATGSVPSARTTASILQELISALTAERPISSEGSDLGLDRLDSENSEALDSNSQENLKSKTSSWNSRVVDRFSPGCVLDGSFSTESCVSSTLDDVSVKFAFNDVDSMDSASSTKQSRKSDTMGVINLVNHTLALLQNVNRVHGKLTATKRDHIQEIVLIAELLFGKDGLSNSTRFGDFLFGPFLDELETLVIAAWKNNIILGIDVAKKENSLRRFLIDCLVECLDVKYSRFTNTGFGAWCTLPKIMDAEILIKVFDDEVRKWISFAGKTTDEIIEREMSTSYGKWTDFEIEAFETGEQINQDITQNLVDEIVTDLFKSELTFC